MSSMTIEKKIKHLESLCPGMKFMRPVEPPEIHFWGPTFRSGRQKFTVNLDSINMTFDEWLDECINQYGPHPYDEAYYVICRKTEFDMETLQLVHTVGCGSVNIKHSGYISQLSNPDVGWVCPKCGSSAQFDDETYEDFMEKLQEGKR